MQHAVHLGSESMGFKDELLKKFLNTAKICKRFLIYYTMPIYYVYDKTIALFFHNTTVTLSQAADPV